MLLSCSILASNGKRVSENLHLTFLKNLFSGR